MASSEPVQLSVTGSFSLNRQGELITQFSYDKVKALFILMLLSDKAVPRHQLAQWLWPDQEIASSRTNLRHALHSLRQTLGGAEEALVISRQSLALFPPDHWQYDLRDLAACLEQPPSVDNLAAVLNAYGGELVSELALPQCADFQRWLLEQREHWRRRVLQYLEQGIEAHASLPMDILNQATRAFPHYDAFQRRTIASLVDEGRMAAARDRYNAYLEQLAVAGRQPSAELLKLARFWSGEEDGDGLSSERGNRARATTPSDEPPVLTLTLDDIDYRQISVMVMRINLPVKKDPSRQWTLHCLDAQRQMMRWLEQQCRHLGGFWLPGTAGGLGMACFGTHGPAHQLAELVALYEHCRRDLNDQLAVCWQGGEVKPHFELSAGLHSGRAIFIPERRMVDPLGTVTQPALELVCAARDSELVISLEASHQMPPALDLQPRLFMRLWAANGEVRNRMLVLSDDHSAEPLPPHLFGREEPVRQLEAALSRASIGLRQSVLIRGESGMGKSALMVNFRQMQQSNDMDICWVSNTRVSYQEPFGLLRTLFRWRLGGVLTRSSLEQVRKAHPRASLWSEEDTQLFYNLLGVCPECDPGMVRQRRAMELATMALQMMIERRCESHSFILMLDDIQWIDEASLKILADVQARMAIHHPLLVVASLPLNSPLASQLQWDRDIVLGRLEPAQTTRLLDYLLRRYRLSLGSSARQQLLDRCDGVPLYLQEICRRLYSDRREGHPVQIERLPSGLVGLLSSRIDQLDEFRSEAHVASVIGRQFSVDLLQKILRLTDRRLKQALERMRRMEVIERCVNNDEFDYQFSHQLLHEAAYQGCHPDVRQHTHAFLVDLIERERPYWLSRYPGYFAHHLYHCGHHARAARYFELAARDALRAGARKTAMAMACDGLECLDHVQGGEERHISLLMVKGHAGLELEGCMSPSAERSFAQARVLQEALETDPAEEDGQDDQYFIVLWGQMIVMNERLQLGTALAQGELLLAAAAGLRDVHYGKLARMAWACTRFFMGDIATSNRALVDLLPLDQELSLSWLPFAYHPVVQCNTLLACGVSYHADYQRAEFHMDAVVDASRQLRHPPSEVMALIGSACLYRRHGHVRLVEERANASLALIASSDLNPWRWSAECLCGWVDAVQGKHEGVILMESALESLSEGDFGNIYCLALVWYVEACQALGYHARAARVIEQNVAEFRAAGVVYLPELLVNSARNEVARQGDVNQVKALLAEAINISRLHGNLHYELLALDAWLELVDRGNKMVLKRFEGYLLALPASDAPLMMRFHQRLHQLQSLSVIG
ncbi:AAA family ATPase [Larsenimonas rhizosphaerae]|uniref:AAA family ATPase n=1 Tax=Larsenimonas rhizosphaerae TaxID=2944682 RepID=UPI002034317B|nr:AAA family ATPase [Larsenimonas rhizosphaerae]MCM2130346.1 AAA family ATPase [Larsenimonas rhizosphaerae]